MPKTEFDKFVKRQQTKAQEEGVLDPQAELQQWRDHLDALYEQITKFMKDYIQNGSAKIEYQNIELNEDFVGPYIVRKMFLKIGLSTVTFTPVGTMLIGTKGRVDVQGPLGKTRLSLVNKQVTSARQLVHVTIGRIDDRAPPAPAKAVKDIQWAWKISRPPPEMTFIELTQDAFFDMIISVANA